MKRTILTVFASMVFVVSSLAAPLPPGQHGGSNGPGQPLEERLREATAPFQSPIRAMASGYVDIKVFVSGQGFHYLNPQLLDATFDPDHPELLVYSPDTAGVPHLVAVEYAVPLDLSPNPPEGFPGDDDVWERNETFGIWTLHAWAWRDNPSGFFADTNPLVP
jgi:hypothetical protein